MAKNNEPGYVYILTNPSFREDWVKIGKSSRPVDVRSKELDNTAVPLPFEIYATIETHKFNEVERQIHRTIDRISQLRIRQNREFFNVAPDVALAMFVDVAMLIDDAKVYRYINNEPRQVYPVDEATQSVDNTTEQPKEKRTNFRFSMIGLQPGEKIIFDPCSIEVTIADDQNIEYEGRLWRLSRFAATYMPESMQNNSGTYQGPKYFSYDGKTLNDRRLEQELDAEDQQEE